MTISDKTLRAMQHSRDTTNKHLCGAVKDRALAQAVINAAWTDFHKDLCTWPKEGEWCFVEMKSAKRKPAFLQFIKGRWWPHNGVVVRYAYPNDLLFVQQQPKIKD